MLVRNTIFEIPKSTILPSQIHHFASLVDPHSFLRPNSTKAANSAHHPHHPISICREAPLEIHQSTQWRRSDDVSDHHSECQPVHASVQVLSCFIASADVSTDPYEKWDLKKTVKSWGMGISLSEQEIELFFKIGLGKITGTSFFCSFGGFLQIFPTSNSGINGTWSLDNGIPESSLN